MSRSIPTLRYQACMLHLEGLSYVQVALPLPLTKKQTWDVVNRVLKTSPLPLMTMPRRAS